MSSFFYALLIKKQGKSSSSGSENRVSLLNNAMIRNIWLRHSCNVYVFMSVTVTVSVDVSANFMFMLTDRQTDRHCGLQGRFLTKKKKFMN